MDYYYGMIRISYLSNKLHIIFYSGIKNANIRNMCKINCFVVLILLPRVIFSAILFANIGIGYHQDHRIQDLDYSLNDCSYLSFQLNTIYSDHNFKEYQLIDSAATYAAVRKLFLVTISQKIKLNDTLIVYFSGHGALLNSNQVIVLHDSRVDDYSTFLYEDELALWLSRIDCGFKLLIFDNCSSIDFNFSQDHMPVYKGFNELKNIVILSATAPNKAARESQEIEHSIFTFLLCNGINGYADQDFDSKIFLPELKNFMQEYLSKDFRLKSSIPQFYFFTENKKGFYFPVPKSNRSAKVIAITGQNAIIDMGKDFLPFKHSIFKSNETNRNYAIKNLNHLYAIINSDQNLKKFSLLYPVQNEMSAEIILDVVPWAMVQLDNKAYGYSPIRIRNIIPKEYELKLSHPNIGTKTVNINLEPGESKKMRIDLYEEE